MKATRHRSGSAWSRFPLRTKSWWLDLLLSAGPLAIALHLTDSPPLLVFIFSALGIVPLASVLGEATEQLAAHTGPAFGGILNATMGNAAELLIGFFALRAGHIEVVKASLSGSIIGNLLLVLGLSALVGGIGRESQKFSRTAATMNTTMLFIAVAALAMPAVYDLAVFGSLSRQDISVERLSLWTSGLLIGIYLLSFVFVLKTHKSLFTVPVSEQKEGTSVRRAALALIISTALIAVLSEMMVAEIGAVRQALGWTELFVGVIVVAIVGNAAEHGAAVMMARRGKMDLALTIAVGSSTQIALFVAPLLVFLSYAIARPMSLVFNAFEIAAIVLSVLIVEMISSDGETNWLEGAQLLAVYGILVVCFYIVPG